MSAAGRGWVCMAVSRIAPRVAARPKGRATRLRTYPDPPLRGQVELERYGSLIPPMLPMPPKSPPKSPPVPLPPFFLPDFLDS